MIVNQFKHRLFVRCLLHRWCVGAPIFLLAWGVANLILRAAYDIPALMLLNGLWGLLLFLMVTSLLEWRRLPDHTVLTALIDQTNRMGGLLMSSERMDTSSWLTQRPAPQCPQIRWRMGSKAAVCLLMMLFTGATFFTPYYLNPNTLTNKLEIGASAAELREKVSLLKEEALIQPDKADQLEQQLDRMEKNARANDPARAWETLDHLNDRIQAEADKNVQNLTDQMAAVKRAENLALMLAHADQLQPSVRTQAMRALTQMLKDISQGGDASPLLNNDQRMRALGNGASSSEQLASLSGNLQKFQKQMAERLKRLQASGMSTANWGKVPELASPPDDSGLEAFLKANAQNMTMADISALCQNPGRGGVSRGRGDAVMTWKEPSSQEGSRFRDVTTPSAGFAGAQENQLLGVTLAPPSKGESEAPPKPGALNQAEAGSGAARLHKVRPRHKGPVRRYFDRSPKPKPRKPDYFDEIWSGWS